MCIVLRLGVVSHLEMSHGPRSHQDLSQISQLKRSVQKQIELRKISEDLHTTPETEHYVCLFLCHSWLAMHNSH
jgi:hypothetical protein